MNERCTAETLKVLVVTEDRVLERQLTQFFELIGYPLLQAADCQTARAAVEAESPQVVVLDCDLASAADWELCRQLSRRPGESACFKFLLVEDPEDAVLKEGLEAGIDDFLLKPISYGELLARVRAAARVLEHDRRASQQSRVDPLTGLLSESAFQGHLRRQLNEHGGAAASVGCVVMDVDFFARVTRLHGETAARSLARSIGQQLNQLRSGAEVLGSLAIDRFVAMLPGANEAAAAQWAEKARETLAGSSFKLAEVSQKISASFGAAAGEAGERPDQLLERAVQALATAKASGRNCVVAWSERDGQVSEQLTPETLFARTVARDIMTPLAVCLQSQDTAGDALAALARTRLEAIPVVDGKGRFQGLCQEAELAEVSESDYTKATVGDVLVTDVPTFDQHESLDTLLTFFNENEAPLAVVLGNGRPLGIVTCDSLIAMSRPVQLETLAATPYDDGSAYLLVPDVFAVEPELQVAPSTC